MITINGIDDNATVGFLGNRLFMIANGLNLAKENKDELVLPPFEFQDTFKHKLFRIDPEVKKINFIDYNEPFFHYHPVPYTEKLRLNGYFQSYKYFGDLDLQEIFDCNDGLKVTISSTNSELGISYLELFTQYKVCSIHLRFGDYTNLAQFHTNLGDVYYHEAVEIMGQMTEIDYFLVFSNDINRARTMFKGDKFIFSDTKQEKPQGNSAASFDLYLQSFCHHHIIANSTFSWWAAYLNKKSDKIVVSPGGSRYNWFGPALSKHDTKDLIPSEWISL